MCLTVQFTSIMKQYLNSSKDLNDLAEVNQDATILFSHPKQVLEDGKRTSARRDSQMT